MVEPRPMNGTERALGRIEGRLDAIEGAINKPVECVQGVLVMQKLDYLMESIEKIGETSNDNKAKIVGCGERVKHLDDVTTINGKAIADHSILIDDLLDNKEHKTQRLIALVGAVAMIVSATISAIVSAML